MSKTKIEWCARPGTLPETWNPTTGCNKVSQGCKNCYAEVMHRRLMVMFPKKYSKPFLAGAEIHRDVMGLPFKWNKPRTVFVNSMSDLFHEDVPEIFIREIFSIMASNPDHTFQVLTKRPERMMEIVNRMEWTHGLLLFEKYILFNNCLGFGMKAVDGPWLPKNIWLGVSTENQETADERIPFLLQTKAAVRFLSCEPLLGFIDIKKYLEDENTGSMLTDCIKIDWVIAGGESGHGARPMHPDWVRGLRDQCVSAEVPFFFKQWGEYIPMLAEPQHPSTGHDSEFYCPAGDIADEFSITADVILNGIDFYKVGKKKAGRELDGREWNEFPNTTSLPLVGEETTEMNVG